MEENAERAHKALITCIVDNNRDSMASVWKGGWLSFVPNASLQTGCRKLFIRLSLKDIKRKPTALGLTLFRVNLAFRWTHTS